MKLMRTLLKCLVGVTEGVSVGVPAAEFAS
jgi:hypothetical protein